MAQIKYTFETSNGQHIGDVLQLESNGVGNRSLPIQITNILIIDNKPVFTINGDFSSRFVLGFDFDIEVSDSSIDTQFVGSYTVGSFEYEPGVIVTGSLYDPTTNLTYVPSADDVPRDASIVLRVDSVTNAVYVAASTPCMYIPSTQVELQSTGTADDGTYTVAAVETATTYPVQNVISQTSISVYGENAHIFRPNFDFSLIGDVGNPAFGITYTVDSSSNVSGTTVINLKTGPGYNELPAGTIPTGSLTLNTATTYVALTETVSTTSELTGVLSTSETQTFNIILSNLVTTSTSNTTTVSIDVDGDKAVYFEHFKTTGCTIQVKDNSFLVNNRLVVTDVLYNAGTLRTTITAEVTKPVGINDVFPNYGGTIITPPLSVDYGYIRYVVPEVLTSLKLIGQGTTLFNNVSTWGYAIQQNMINLLDHFADTVAPVSPIIGQLWYDRSTAEMKVYDLNHNWQSVATNLGNSDLDMHDFRIYNLGDAIDDQDAMNRRSSDERYVQRTGSDIEGDFVFTGPGSIELNSTTQSLILNDTIVTGDTVAMTLSGGSLIVLDDDASIVFDGDGTIDMGGNKILNVGTPTDPTDAANKSYVDGLSSGIVWLQPLLDPNVVDDSLLAPPDPDVDPLVKFDKTYYVTAAGATGDWASFAGHLVVYTSTDPEDPLVPYTWKSVTGQELSVGDRVGVFFDPKNNDPSNLSAGGSFAGQVGKIAVASAINTTTKVVTWTFITPTEPDAVSVNGPRSPRFRFSYTFRGVWGSGAFGVDYDWIEFSGPTAIIPGRGLAYTDNVLSLLTSDSVTTQNGTIEVIPNSPGLNARFVLKAGDTMTGFLLLNANPTANLHATTKQYTDTRDTATLNSANAYTNAEIVTVNAAITAGDSTTLTSANNYTNSQINTTLKLSGGTMTGFLTLNANPTANLHAVTKQYVDAAVPTSASLNATYLRVDGTNAATANLNIGGFQLKNLATPTLNGDAATKQYVDAAVSGGGTTDVKDVKVSETDTTPAFLRAKLQAGANVTLSVLNVGADEIIEISSTGGGGGTGTTVVPRKQEFVAGTDYTAGTSSSITIATNRPATKDALDIYFTGVYQHSSKYSYNPTTGAIIFTTPIPVDVEAIECKWITIV